MTPDYDKITIDVAMEPSMHPIVFAVINRSKEKDIQNNEEWKDLKVLTKRRSAEHFRGFPSNLAVYSESVESVPELLPESCAKVLGTKFLGSN
jgi:hypothetical protein